MVKIEYDEEVVERNLQETTTTMDWTPFPVGFGVLLNERYQFPLNMALARMKLDTSRQLFVDNHVIGHMQGLVRETHSTREHPENPVFAPYRNYPAYICPDPEHGYRLYYHGGGFIVRVAYSRDGIEWEMPHLNLMDVSPEGNVDGPNNVVMIGEMHGLLYEPDDPDPDRRWKAIIRPGRYQPYRHTAWPYLRLSEGMGTEGTPFELHTSPDGFRWRFEAETSFWKGPSGAWEAPDYLPVAGGDVLRVRWDPVLKKYIGNTKHRIGPDYRLSPVMQSARAVGQMESDDLIHWSPPRIYAYPDGEDTRQQRNAMHGIYEADGYPYESMWFSNFSMTNYIPARKEDVYEKNLMPTRPYIKRNWMRKAASRDGRHWYYFGDRKPFIPLGPDGSWKSGYIRAANLVTTGGPIVKGDELWYYYRGATIDGPKDTWQSATGIAILRRDGFASLNADHEGGIVITRPFVFEGRGMLHVNAQTSAGGSIRASVVDEDTAKPLTDFTEDDSATFTGDSTCAPLRWRHRDSLAELKKRYVRLAFHLKNARLYSFWVE